jgi:hypothetical protein
MGFSGYEHNGEIQNLTLKKRKKKKSFPRVVSQNRSKVNIFNDLKQLLKVLYDIFNEETRAE